MRPPPKKTPDPHYTAPQQEQFKGLNAWIPEAGEEASFYGVDRTPVVRLEGIRWDGGKAMEEAFEKLRKMAAQYCMEKSTSSPLTTSNEVLDCQITWFSMTIS